MILKLCLKTTNLFNILYLDNGDYKGATCNFQDNVTVEELVMFYNKCMFPCFNSKRKLFIIFCFSIFMRLLTCTETHIMIVDMI